MEALTPDNLGPSSPVAVEVYTADTAPCKPFAGIFLVLAFGLSAKTKDRSKFASKLKDNIIFTISSKKMKTFRGDRCRSLRDN